MSSCDDNRELIQGNGWKQGAVFALDPDLVKDYIRTHTLDKFPLKGKYKAHLLVISQDCDVLNTGIDEPFVECLVISFLCRYPVTCFTGFCFFPKRGLSFQVVDNKFTG